LSGYGDLSRFSFKELKKTFHVMKSDISLFSDDPKNSSICSFIEVVMAHKKWNDSFLSLFCSIKMISPRGLERRESSQNLSDLITEQSDDFSVTRDYLVAFFSYDIKS
jgi:hypothetical protein